VPSRVPCSQEAAAMRTLEPGGSASDGAIEE
jgi:hypothetical protein